MQIVSHFPIEIHFVRSCPCPIRVYYDLYNSLTQLTHSHVLPGYSKYMLTPNQNELIPTTLSPDFISDNYIKKIPTYKFESMDETDNASKKSFISDAIRSNGRPNVLRFGGGSGAGEKRRSGGGALTTMRNFMNSRPGQAVQIRTDVNGARTLDHDDEEDDDDEDGDNSDVEVGQCKISTITIQSPPNALEKKVEYLSDNQLDKIANGVSDGSGTLNDDTSNDGDTSLENLSECLPTTSNRNQNDLIQFVFTSHGIRVISDKEYVV